MSAPTGILFYDPRAKPLSTTGQFQPGCYWQFFQTGTTTPAPVYADGGLTTPLSQVPGAPNPSCTAASDGRFVPIYLNPSTVYRVQLYNAAGVLLEDVDPIVNTYLYPTITAEQTAGVTPVNYSYPPGNALRYGADPTGTTPSDSAINSALLVPGVAWFVPPGLYSCNNTVTATNPGVNYTGAPGILTIQGTLQASQSFPAPVSSVAQYVLNLAGDNMIVRTPTTDGNITSGANTCIANGIAVNGGRVRIYGPSISHSALIGLGFVSTTSGDSFAYDVFIQEFNNGDAQWGTAANFVADGVQFNRADCGIIGGEIRWNGIGLHATQYAATSFCIGVHIYNGFLSANPWADPVIVQTDLGSSGIILRDCYLDNGHIKITGNGLTMRDCFALQTTACTFSVDANGVANFIQVYNGNALAGSYQLDIVMNTGFLQAGTNFIGFLPQSGPISAASGTGTVATFTVPTQRFAYQTGGFVTITGMLPSGYNGTYQVIAGTTSTISVANTTTGAMTQAGTATANWTGDYSYLAQLITVDGFQNVVTSNGEVYIYDQANQNIPARTWFRSNGFIQQNFITGDAQALGIAPSYTTTSASGTGSVATIGFVGAVAPTVGSVWTVYGVTPVGYNGTYAITASTVNSISYANTTTGAQTVAGTAALTPHRPTIQIDGAMNSTAQGFRSVQTQFLAIKGDQSPLTTYPTSAASGDGSHATITFPIVQSAPVVGSTWIVSGVVPAGYNGTYVLTASSTTSATYANATTGAQTTVGTISLSQPAELGMNLTGVSFRDNGALIGAAQWTTQNVVRLKLHGPSDGSSTPHTLTAITDATMDLGTVTVGFNNIFSDNALNIVSDGRAKVNVTPSDLGLSFINRLEPSSYQRIIGGYAVTQQAVYHDSKGSVVPPRHHEAHLVQPEILSPVPGKRKHYGLVAQKVREAAIAEGVTDFGGWLIADLNDPESRQMLRYEELIAPMIKAIQELSAEVAALKAPPAPSNAKP